MWKFKYTEGFFIKIMQINVTKKMREWSSYSQAFNWGIKNTIENKGWLPNTQMNYIQNFFKFN